jgi:hypothetical protein
MNNWPVKTLIPVERTVKLTIFIYSDVFCVVRAVNGDPFY